MEQLACSECGIQVSEENRFCPNCGGIKSQPAATAANASVAGAAVAAVPPPPFVAASMLCGQCGKEFAFSRFCPNCGAAADASASRREPAAAPLRQESFAARAQFAGDPAAQFAPAARSQFVPSQTPQGVVFCGHCRAQMPAGNVFCVRCGQSMQPGVSSLAQVEYAGFWIRLIADLIDTVVMAVVVILFSMAPVVNVAIAILVICLYGAATESSKAQASLGKRALGLKVTDLDGARISFGKAFGRWLIKEILSVSVVGLLSFVIVGFTLKKQGVHDLMVGTLVVKNR